MGAQNRNRAYRYGSDWRVDIHGNAGTTCLDIHSGSGRVTDASGAATIKSDCTIAIMALNAAGATDVADRVAMWMRTQNFG